MLQLSITGLVMAAVGTGAVTGVKGGATTGVTTGVTAGVTTGEPVSTEVIRGTNGVSTAVRQGGAVGSSEGVQVS